MGGGFDVKGKCGKGKKGGEHERRLLPVISAGGIEILRNLNQEEITEFQKRWTSRTERRRTWREFEEAVKVTVIQHTQRILSTLKIEKMDDYLNGWTYEQVEQALDRHPRSSEVIAQLKGAAYETQQVLALAKMLVPRAEPDNDDHRQRVIDEEMRRQNALDLERLRLENESLRRRMMDAAEREAKEIERKRKKADKNRFEQKDLKRSSPGEIEVERPTAKRTRVEPQAAAAEAPPQVSSASSSTTEPSPTGPGEASTEVFLSCSNLQCDGKFHDKHELKPACCPKCGAAWSGAF